MAARLSWRPMLSVGFAACAGLALLETLKSWLVRRLEGSAHGFAYSLVENVPWWLLWMLCLPPVLWLARTVRFDDGRRRRAAAIHAAGCFAVSLAHVTATGVVHYLTLASQGAAGGLGAHVRVFVLRFLFTDVVIYCAVLGIYYACEYFAGYRETAVAAESAELRAERLQLRLAEARLRALRMELNPHFLFNTLNAIAGLVRKHERQGAIEMLARLGDLLRATLDRDMPPEVPLRDELDLLRRYLAVELVRFGDRLRVTWDVEPEAEAARVPPLILQPLVENAIRHGISRRAGGGLLTIAARRLDAQLELTVRDTGEGFGLRDGRALREGIGISNTKARLLELYGPDATTLELCDAPAGGACARVLIPHRLADDSHDVASWS